VDELGERVKDRKRKKEMLSERALSEMSSWRDELGLVGAAR
jgi:folate-dependent tRNA-U54 methylase TrmFO/GidA